MNYRQSGFSLLELMVALLLVGILTSVAVPGYRSMVQNNKISSATTTLMTAINHARSEASKRNISINICGGESSSGSACRTTNSRFWSESTHLILFYDYDYENNDDSRILDNPAPTCADPFIPGIRDCIVEVIWDKNLSNDETKVIFHEGDSSKVMRIRGDGSSGDSSTVFHVCDSRGRSRTIAIGLSGRTSVGKHKPPLDGPGECL